MLRAAIDIGSNTFRMLIARSSAGKSWETKYYTHRIVRLSEGLQHTGRLSENGMQRAMQAMQEFSAIIREHDLKPANTLAVATAAMREAENGAALRQQILEQSGIPIRIVDGQTEAAMSLAGATAVLKTEKRSNMLLFDIGGGSTEFVRSRNTLTVDTISRKMGVVRLVEAHLSSDPPSESDYQAMLNAADGHLKAVESHWGDACIPDFLIGTAGTVTTLAAIHLNLHPYVVDKINNHVITEEEFYTLRDRLLGMTHAERQALPTIEQGRADLMVAGLAIIQSIFQRWHYDELSIVDAGLLEGAWLSAQPSSPASIKA